MVTQLARNWWVVALRGFCAIIFGLLAFIWPGITLAVLVIFFGAYALIDGVIALVAALRNSPETNHWLLLLEGIVGILVGLLTFFWPGVTTFALIYLIGAWAVVTGIFEILAALDLRKTIPNEWLLILDGLLSLLFGLLIMLYPRMGALTIAWLVGFYAVAFGLMLVGLGVRLRRHNSQPDLTLTASNHA